MTVYFYVSFVFVGYEIEFYFIGFRVCTYLQFYLILENIRQVSMYIHTIVIPLHLQYKDSKVKQENKKETQLESFSFRVISTRIKMKKKMLSASAHLPTYKMIYSFQYKTLFMCLMTLYATTLNVSCIRWVVLESSRYYVKKNVVKY